MEDKPPSILVPRPAQPNQRMVVEFVENLTHKVEPNASLVGYFVICNLIDILQNVNDLNRFFVSKDFSHFVQSFLVYEAQMKRPSS
jgi:hypothetical protein